MMLGRTPCQLLGSGTVQIQPPLLTYNLLCNKVQSEASGARAQQSKACSIGPCASAGLRAFEPVKACKPYLLQDCCWLARAGGQVWLCPTRLSMALTGGSSAKSQQDVTEGFCIVETNYRVSLHGSSAPAFKQLQHDVCLGLCRTCCITRISGTTKVLAKSILKYRKISCAGGELHVFVWPSLSCLQGMIRALAGCRLSLALKHDLTMICRGIWLVPWRSVPGVSEHIQQKPVMRSAQALDPSSALAWMDGEAGAWSGKHHQH